MGPGLGAACLEPHLPGSCRSVPSTGWLLICITLKLLCCTQLGKNVTAALLFGSLNAQHVHSVYQALTWRCTALAAACIVSPTLVLSSDQHMLFAGCSRNSAWQQAGMSELCSRQPQARLGNVTGHPGNSGKHAFYKQDRMSMAAFICTNQRIDRNVNMPALSSVSPLLS